MLMSISAWHVQIKDPVCVFIFREPISNAVSLTDNAKKSAAKDGFKEMTPARWLKAWEEGVSPARPRHEDEHEYASRVIVYASRSQPGCPSLVCISMPLEVCKWAAGLLPAVTPNSLRAP